MTFKQQWTRRQFSQALALSAASSMFMSRASALLAVPLQGFAFAGSAASGGTIHIFRVAGSTWQPVEVLAAVMPAHLLLHPALPVLYAVHNVSHWENLPRGAVSAYALDPVSGRLNLLGTQPLSLSATHPKHATLTADGGHLFVAAERGGIYNLLPVERDGMLQPVTHIRKQFGGDRHDKISAPRTVLLHPDGSLLTADPGQETLTAFRFDREGLSLRHRVRVHGGDGPSHLAITPCGSYAYALHAGSGALSVHAVANGQIGSASQVLSGMPDTESMLVAPGGSFLLTAATDRTRITRIDPASGRLSAHGTMYGTGATALSFGPGGGHLLGVDSRSGQILATPFDGASGTAGPTVAVAEVDDCVSVAYRSSTRLI